MATVKTQYVSEYVVRTSNAVGPSKALEKAMAQLLALAERLEKGLEGLEGTGKGAGDGLGETGKGAKDAAEKLKELVRQQKIANDIMREHGVSASAAGRSVKAFGKDLDRAEKEAGQYARQLDEAEKETRQLSKSQEGGGVSVGKMTGGLISGVAALALLAKGIALARQELEAIIRTQAAFSDRMSTVRGITRATAEEYALLSGRARELGASTRFTATEVADAEVFLARAGFEVQEIYDTLPAVLNLAAAAQLDLGQAADITSNIMQAFGKDASQTSEVVDVLAAIATSANTDISQLAEGMKFAGPVAAGLGKTVGETAAAIGVLSDAGLQASLAGTGLRRVMSELESPAKKSRDIIASLGLTLAEVQPSTNSLVAIFERLADAGITTGQSLELAGDRGGPALQVLTDGVAKLATQSQALTEVDGRAEELADQMQGPSSRAARELESAIEELRLEAGGELEPALADLLNTLRDFTRESDAAAGSIGRVLSLAVAKLNNDIRQLFALASVGTGDLSDIIFGGKAIDVERNLKRAAEAIEGLAKAREAAYQRGMEEAMAREVARLAREAEEAEEQVVALATGIQKLVDESETFKTAAEFVKDFGLSIEEASQAATLKLNPAIKLTDEEIVYLILDAREAKRALDEAFETSTVVGLRQKITDLSARIKELQELEEPVIVERVVFDDEQVQDALAEALADAVVNVGVTFDRPELEEFSPLSAPDAGTGEIPAGPAMFNTEEFTAELHAGLTEVALDFGRVLAQQFAQAGPIHEEAFALFQGLASVLGASLGAAFGGPAGAAIGASIGSLVSSLFGGLFKKGADEAFARFEVLDEQLQVVARTIEGQLGPALGALTKGIIQTVDLILAEFGGDILTGEFGIKIRQGEEIRVFWGGVMTTFEKEADAASFLVAKIISTSLIEGLGASVAEALKGSEFTSTEELLSALDFAEGIDAALRTPWEQFISEVTADMRVRLTIAADLGIATERVVEAERRRIQSLIDEAAALVRSVGGVQSFLGEWEQLQDAIAIAGPAGVAKLEEELRAGAEAALLHADATSRSSDGLARSREEFESYLFDLKVSDEVVKELGERWEELAAEGKTADEIVAELITTLEGLSSAEIQQALQNFRQNFVVGLLGQLASLADLAGKGELAERLRARALELQTRMQLLSIRATLQAARAAGILSDEQVRGFNRIIQEIQRGINEMGGFGALGQDQGGGGGGGGGGRTRADALADLNRLLAETADLLAGVTAEERARLDALAVFDAHLASGRLTLEEYQQAIVALDAVMAAAAQAIADDITARWAELGRVLGETPLDTQLRRLWEEAVAGMDLGGEGIPDIFQEQVLAWFEEALEGASTPEEFQEILEGWEDFIAGLPPDIRRALLASGMGEMIAEAIAESVARANLDAFLEAAVLGFDLPAADGGGAAGGRASARGGFRSAASGASDELERLREELDDFLEAARKSRLGPVARQLEDIFDKFARVGSILKTLKSGTDEFTEAGKAMAAELADAWQDAFEGLRDLADEIRGETRAPAESFDAARSRFQELIAGLPSDLSQLDPDQLREIAEAGRAFREAGRGIFGEEFGGRIVGADILEDIEGLLAQQPTENELLRDAIDFLRQQVVIGLDEIAGSLGGGGALVAAIEGTGGGGAGNDLTLLQLVEIARITGVLLETVEHLDGLSVEELSELQATVAALLAIEGLSEAQRAELEALQVILDNQEIINLLSGTLAVAGTLDSDELTALLELLGGTLAVADQLAPEQLAALLAIIEQLLGLETLTEEQRGALEASAAALAAIQAAGEEPPRQVPFKTDPEAAQEQVEQTERLDLIVASLAEISVSGGMMVEGQAAQGLQFGALLDRVGEGNLNATAQAMSDQLGTLVSDMGQGGAIRSRLSAIANHTAWIGQGNANAELRVIKNELKGIRQALGSGSAG